MSSNKHTEKELLNVQKMQTYFIDMKNNGWGDSFDELDEMLPCIYHLNNKDTMEIEYLSKKGCDFMHLSLEQIIELGPAFFDKYLAAEQVKIIPKLVDFYQSGEENAVFSFFQQIRPAGLDHYEWIFTTTKISARHEALITVSTPVRQLAAIGNKMNRILEENSFMKKNFNRFMTLTGREVEIIALLAQGYKNVEVGDMLFLSSQTVKQHRKNIYKKLDISNIVELLRYAQAFDLV